MRYRNTNKNLRLVLAASAALGVGAHASADLLAYDGFDYPTGTLDFSGSAADPGWSSDWIASTGSTSSVVGPGLTYPGLDTLGNAVDTAGDATTIDFRSLDTSFGDDETGETWLSFLIQPGAEVNYSNFVGVTFYDGGLSGAKNIEFGRNDPSGSAWKLRTYTPDIFANADEADSPMAGVTALLVVQVLWDDVEDDTVNLFVNPLLNGTVPTDPDATAAAAVLFDSVRFAGQNGESYLMDELRIGETFADVTPGPGVTILPGDTNGDGDVDNSDLQAAISNFTGPQTDPPTFAKTLAEGDNNADGAVSNVDLQAAISNFTGPIGGAPVPEPAGLALLGLGGLALARRRNA